MGIKDDPGGEIAHGSFSGGLSPVKVQNRDRHIRTSAWVNLGPGIMYAGTDAVTIGNTIGWPVGKGFVFEDSASDLWIVWDMAGSAGRFMRELAP